MDEYTVPDVIPTVQDTMEHAPIVIVGQQPALKNSALDSMYDVAYKEIE